jgi:proteasome accessory factor B
MARDKTERLLNLLIALTATSRPMGREELREALADHYGRDQSDDAFEKMFERDKDELRSMGIPIDTVTNAHNEVIGYRVDDGRLRMSPLSLTTSEAAVIATAASLWTTASVSHSARSARLKLEAMGERQEPSDLGLTTYLQAPEAVFEAVLEAATTRRRIRFNYRKPGDTVEHRHVEPWGLVSREGHWYLVSFDLDREGIRVFRLSRVVGEVRTEGPTGSFTVPDGTDLSSHVRASTRESAGVVRVHVDAGHAVALRRQAGVDLDSTEFEVRYEDLDLIVADIAAQGDRVLVVDDGPVRAAVISHLRALVT